MQTTNLTGNLQLEDTSQFNVKLDGKAGLADRIIANGNVLLGGSLNLTLINSGSNPPGDSLVGPYY